MNRLNLALAATLALGAGIALVGPSSAAVGVPDGMRPALDEIGVIDNVQYVWRGRRYCWYDDGWRGPGWYQCGYHLRVGLGWGGPVGWHGWRHGFRGDVRTRESREFRRGERREFRSEGREFRREGGEVRGGREFRGDVRGGREFRGESGMGTRQGAGPSTQGLRGGSRKPADGGGGPSGGAGTTGAGSGSGGPGGFGGVKPRGGAGGAGGGGGDGRRAATRH
jgi:hypothetical protein